MAAYKLEDQISELRRERALRERVYPRQIKVGDMDQGKADRQLGLLDAALETLAFVAAAGAVVETADFAGGKHPASLTIKHAGALVRYRRVEDGEEKDVKG